MKGLRKTVSLILAFLMGISLVLTGCGSDKDKSDTGTTAATTAATTAKAEESTAAATTAAANAGGWDTSKKDKVVLSVINNYYTAGEKQLAQDYMKLHPETEVVVDVVASNDAYNTKLKTTLTTDKNTAPDIIHANFLPGAVNASWQTCYEKNYIMDLTPMLDETNPYNDNKLLRDEFEAQDITRAISNAGGKMGMLPFDFVGIGFFYNKTVFDKNGLAAPATYEDLLAACETLKGKGFNVPCVAAAESSWVQDMIADVGYRNKVTEFLAQPGDAIYDEATMSANAQITVDKASDPTFDLLAIMNDERQMSYVKKNGYNTPINKTIWTEFGKLASYFQQNWVSPDSAKVLTAFEAQTSPIMCSGSWNVGALVADVAKLPADKQFQWGTFALPGFKNAPAGFEAPMRSLYVFGNVMGIIQKDNPDHEARVKDVMKYWYSPKVAQMMYDVTLKSGNYVQGPPAIKGVTLSEENSLRLNGFISKGSVQGWGPLFGQTTYLQQDLSKYNALCNKLTNKQIKIEDFLKQLNAIAMRAIDDKIKKSGYDLDPKTKDTPQQ